MNVGRAPEVFPFTPVSFLRFSLLAGVSVALLGAAEKRAVRFEKLVLTDQYFCDGVNAADFNRDGKMDVVAGPYWYAGPDFKTKHTVYPPELQELEAKPSDSLFSFGHDFNGFGWVDVLVLGRVLHHQAFWYENPGKSAGPWKKHFAIHRVLGESPQFLDLDGDGMSEVLAHHEGQWGAWKPDTLAPTKPWTFLSRDRKGFVQGILSRRGRGRYQR